MTRVTRSSDRRSRATTRRTWPRGGEETLALRDHTASAAGCTRLDRCAGFRSAAPTRAACRLAFDRYCRGDAPDGILKGQMEFGAGIDSSLGTGLSARCTTESEQVPETSPEQIAQVFDADTLAGTAETCLLYTSPSPRDRTRS